MGAEQHVRGAALLWARSDLRRRWRSLVVLALLAGLTAGLALAAVVGARRTSTAFPRLRERTLSADAVVFPSQVGKDHADWRPVLAKGYVTHLARWSLLFGAVDGDPSGLLFGPYDRHWFNDVDRPLVIQGRMLDPKATDEVVVDESAARTSDLHIGSTFSYQFFARGQTDEDGEPPHGPTIQMHVVGVIRNTSQFLFGNDGFVYASPAVIEVYGQKIWHLENAHVRLRHPATDTARLQRDVDALLEPGTPVLDFHAVQRRLGTALSVERTALLLLAAAVAAAGLVFVGQALGRSVAVVEDDAEVLRSIGFARSDVAMAAFLPHVAVAATGTVVALATAIAVSSRFPIGYGRQVEPDPGLHADWAILGPGVIATAVIVLAGAAVRAWRASIPKRGVTGRPRLGLIAAFRSRTPLPVGLGTTMAFEAGRDRRSIPVRPALIGAMAGVLGIVGTFTLEHGLDDALGHPERVGVTWQATAETRSPAAHQDGHLSDSYLRRLESDPDVADVSTFSRMVINVNGVGAPTFSVPHQSGPVNLVTVDGRAPAADDEAAIGPATARLADVHIGDTVAIGPRHTRVRIVGKALFPVDVHSGFDEGIWLTPATFDAMAPRSESEAPEEYAAIRWKPGVDGEAAGERLGERLADTGSYVAPAEVPPELSNLRNVRTLPKLLAAFLAALAVATLAHVLATSVRRRRHDFAVLRAVGFTRRMTATMVGSQSTAVAITGLVVGIPVGMVVGRLAWTWVARQVPLVYVSPFAAGVVLVVIPAAVLLANLIAAVPGHRASHLRPAEVLRTE